MQRKPPMVQQHPEYAKAVHKSIIEAPDHFYIEIDNGYHRKVVYEICEHYGYFFKTDLVKKVLRPLSNVEQEQLGEPYHGPSCQDCGGREVKIKRITIRKKTYNRNVKDVPPMEFQAAKETSGYRSPQVHPL
ncbi:uvrA [Acrasis kona]|uniref:UvrA n=1 Tax=Acrasis kona TaxID=1008807 RepID=A0AAW2YJ52_9EUKA